MYMRYLLAFIISFSAHALLFSQPEPEKIVKMNTAQAASLPIQFVALPAPKPAPEPVVQQPTPPPKKVERVTPKPDLPKRIIKDEPKVVKKKEVKKPTPPPVKKPKPKPVPKKTPKPVVKKSTPEPKKVEKVEPKEVQKQLTKPTETPKIKQANTKQTTGVNSKPTLVERSRFLSPPTPPKYPRSAKRRGIEGTVTYEVWLDEKGKLDKIVLKNSSGARDLDKAALKAIKRWKFSPHRVNGQSVAHRLYVPIKFELEN